MYDLLTIGELTVLQSMLYQSAEDMYQVTELNLDTLVGAKLYRPAHQEIALLFIEATTELVARIEPDRLAA